MFNLIIIIALILCVLLVFAVLIQNPKGGGLSGTFGGAANQIFGYKRSTDDIEKITWIIVISVFVLSLGSSAFTPTQVQQSNIESPQAPQPNLPNNLNTGADQPVNDDPSQQEDPATTDQGTPEQK